jgi:hypothetical protein
MTDTDKGLVKEFSQLATNFKGERLGLSVFDNSVSSVFPLTDDYDFIKDKLTEVSSGLDGSSSYYSSIFSGTYEGEGSSLIGDGLASCLMKFDNLDTSRSRSVILATDNYVNGAQIIDLKQAGALAIEKSIRVYGINPWDTTSSYYQPEEAKEFHDVALSTGGGYYKIDFDSRSDEGITKDIVNKISAQEATRFKGAPQIVQNDIPDWFVIVVILVLYGVFMLLWRLE